MKEHKHWRIRRWIIGPKGGVKDGVKGSEITSLGEAEAARRAAAYRLQGFGAEISPAYRSALYEGRLD